MGTDKGGRRRRDAGRRDGDGQARPRSDFKSFLKKRAPIYLGLVALFMVFAVPELTKADLQGSLPDLPAEEQRAVDVLMGYNGPNGSGLTLAEAVSTKIAEEYPGERIFNDKRTSVELAVAGTGPDAYSVGLVFKSHKGEISYDWDVDVGSGAIAADDPDSRYIIDLVDFYD